MAIQNRENAFTKENIVAFLKNELKKNSKLASEECLDGILTGMEYKTYKKNQEKVLGEMLLVDESGNGGVANLANSYQSMFSRLHVLSSGNLGVWANIEVSEIDVVTGEIKVETQKLAQIHTLFNKIFKNYAISKDEQTSTIILDEEAIEALERVVKNYLHSQQQASKNQENENTKKQVWSYYQQLNARNNGGKTPKPKIDSVETPQKAFK